MHYRRRHAREDSGHSGDKPIYLAAGSCPKAATCGVVPDTPLKIHDAFSLEGVEVGAGPSASETPMLLQSSRVALAAAAIASATMLAPSAAEAGRRTGTWRYGPPAHYQQSLRRQPPSRRAACLENVPKPQYLSRQAGGLRQAGDIGASAACLPLSRPQLSGPRLSVRVLGPSRAPLEGGRRLRGRSDR